MSMLHELFEDAEPLNERPYSRTQSAIDSAKGGVKGMFGSGQVEQGAREAGDVANRLWVDFKRMIGRKYGKAQSSVPFADVEAFFKTNQLDTKGLGSNANRTFTPKDVGNALLAAAREQVTAEYRFCFKNIVAVLIKHRDMYVQTVTRLVGIRFSHERGVHFMVVGDVFNHALEQQGVIASFDRVGNMVQVDLKLCRRAFFHNGVGGNVLFFGRFQHVLKTIGVFVQVVN